MRGLVINKNANLFAIESEGKNYFVKPRGNLKKDGIFVGDEVEFNETIEKVYERKNILIRPPMANLDRIFIVVSSIPAPDFLLVDKMILCCFVKGIEPIIVINKEDIAGREFVDLVQKTYKNVAKVVICSAKNENIVNLKKEIKGVCAFAGQSAVGKSSLINALFGEKFAEVGELSAKIERGKQTTRMVSLYKIGKGYLADTAGFSSLEVSMLIELNPQEVARYYPDFLPHLSECKYRTCLHKIKGDCGIIKKVENGKISQLRYKNYLKIIDSLATKKR